MAGTPGDNKHLLGSLPSIGLQNSEDGPQGHVHSPLLFSLSPFWRNSESLTFQVVLTLAVKDLTTNNKIISDFKYDLVLIKDVSTIMDLAMIDKTLYLIKIIIGM